MVKRGINIVNVIDNEYKYIDHRGNKFKRKADMLKYYNVSYATFNNRRANGATLEECLKPTNVTDHEGRKFKTIKEMCKFHNISQTSFNKRKRKGYSLSEILTGIDKNGNPLRKNEVKDHKGNIYTSISDMCKKYGISEGVYRFKREKGITIEEALTGRKPPKEEKKTVRFGDHLGNIYDSLNDMCDFYFITKKHYITGVKLGYDIEFLLTGKTTNNRYKADKSVVASEKIDHRGVVYSTNQSMCKQYKIHRAMYINLRLEGLSIKETLFYRPEKGVQDNFGYFYRDEEEMCKCYSVRYELYKEKIAQGLTTAEALGIRK